MAGRRVLITGVGSQLGTRLAAELEDDPEVEYIAGLDTRRPKQRLQRTEWIEADIRDAGLTRVIPRLEVAEPRAGPAQRCQRGTGIASSQLDRAGRAIKRGGEHRRAE